MPTREAARELSDRRRRVLDRADVSDLPTTAGVGDGDRDRGLVHIEADESADLFHDGISCPPGQTPRQDRACDILGQEGHVIWPQAKDGTLTLSTAQLAMLIEGIDWRMPAWTIRPAAAC